MLKENDKSPQPDLFLLKLKRPIRWVFRQKESEIIKKNPVFSDSFDSG